MPVVGDQDVANDVFFRDCSQVTVVETGQTFMGFFLYPEQISTFPPLNIAAGDVVGRPTLQFATALAPPLSHGSLLEVENRGRWQVRSVRQEQDGQVSTAELGRP